MTDHTTTSIPVVNNDLLQYADEPDGQPAELTKLFEGNRRLIARRLKKAVNLAQRDQLANEAAYGRPDLKVLKKMNRQLKGHKFSLLVVAGILIGLFVSLIIASIWGTYAAPNIKGSFIDFLVVIAIVLICAVAGAFFGSALNDWRTKRAGS